MADIQDLLMARYYHPGENNWKALCSRVANFLYPDIKWLGVQLYSAMATKQFIPSTPVLANAGSPLPMLCSCFVVPIEDSIDSIMKSLTDTVKIQKYGGGVGLDFSNIRPEGNIVSTTNGRASGPVSFMGLWNTAMDVVKQGGKRQGALMGAMSVHHQDLYQFIKAKEVEGKLTNMNISVALTEQFFNDLERHTPYACGFTPQQILNDIAYNAWRNGEPGILFLDNINKNNPYGVPITVCNPCAELPLPPYGACCLGSINLNACLDFNGKVWVLNHDKLRYFVNLGVNTLNTVLDKTWWPLPEIVEFEKVNRPIGLGVMGLADMLVKLGVVYGKSSSFITELFADIHQMAEDAARHYAITTLKPMNKTLLSIAPTGSIAMLADCSYGIEPYFSLAYTKKVNAGEFYAEAPVLTEVVHNWGIPYTEIDHNIVISTGSVQQTNLPNDIKLLFRTATEIPWDEHLLLLADVQSQVDNAVSKTINLPNKTSVDTVRKIIMLAHTLGVKGLTVYRSGSREVEVMNDCPSGACSI